MGKLTNCLKHSNWYASKVLNGTRYAEQNLEVRGTPWGEGGIPSCIIQIRRFLESSEVPDGGRGGRHV